MTRTDKAITFIKEIERQLRTIYDDPTLCRQYAWWIVEEITRYPKEELLADHLIQLNDQQLVQLNQWLDKLIKKQMPLQYLIGTVPFNNLEILVEPPILIPRPETEEWTIRLINQLKQLANQELAILDIGTGSGCIALSLANELPQSSIYATDVSDQAIHLAQKNAVHNGIKNLHFMKGDIFDAIPPDMRFDIIISNPPYISEQEWNHLDALVTKWEDKTALVAPHEGLQIIETIVTQSCCYIEPNEELKEKKFANIIIEIGYKQAESVSTIMEKAGFSNILIEKDLEEKDRVVSGRVESCGPCHPSAHIT